MKTKEDILFECWHESNDTEPTNETILKAMDVFAREYHKEQLRIGEVSHRRELLIGLLTKLENGGGSKFIDKEEIVDDYLKDN